MRLRKRSSQVTTRSNSNSKARGSSSKKDLLVRYSEDDNDEIPVMRGKKSYTR